MKQGCVSRATAGERFVYEFLPSGIVECQTVKCMCCNEEFTDYVDWLKENNIMGLNCKKQVGKMRSITRKLENQLAEEARLQKEKKEKKADKR